MQNQEALNISVQNNREIQAVFGEADIYLKSIEETFNVKVQIRSDGLQVIGSDFNSVRCAARSFEF